MFHFLHVVKVKTSQPWTLKHGRSVSDITSHFLEFSIQHVGNTDSTKLLVYLETRRWKWSRPWVSLWQPVQLAVPPSHFNKTLTQLLYQVLNIPIPAFKIILWTWELMGLLGFCSRPQVDTGGTAPFSTFAFSSSKAVSDHIKLDTYELINIVSLTVEQEYSVFFRPKIPQLLERWSRDPRSKHIV